MAFILLCCAVIILTIPAPWPYMNWVAFALALVALIVFCLGLRGGHFTTARLGGYPGVCQELEIAAAPPRKPTVSSAGVLTSTSTQIPEAIASGQPGFEAPSVSLVDAWLTGPCSDCGRIQNLAVLGRHL